MHIDVATNYRKSFLGALVQTGKYSIGDEDACDEEKPTFVFKSIADVIEYVLK